jgi:hypothetical protein
MLLFEKTVPSIQKLGLQTCTVSESANYILWHVDPLLGNDRKMANIQKSLLSNGPETAREEPRSKPRAPYKDTTVTVKQ